MKFFILTIFLATLATADRSTRRLTQKVVITTRTTGKCDIGDIILTKSECESAAQLLGLDTSGSLGLHETQYAPYDARILLLMVCTFRRQNRIAQPIVLPVTVFVESLAHQVHTKTRMAKHHAKIVPLAEQAVLEHQVVIMMPTAVLLASFQVGPVLFAKFVLKANTTIRLDKQVVYFVVQESTATLLNKHQRVIVKVVQLVWCRHQISQSVLNQENIQQCMFQ